MSENLFGLTVAADKGLDDLQCQRLLSENRRYQEVMLQYRCAQMCIRDSAEPARRPRHVARHARPHHRR